MKLEKFRVAEIDDFGGRVSEIRTDALQFQTPSRAATSTEYNYKRTLMIEIPFENDVGEYVARFNVNDIHAFVTRNGSYGNRLRTAASYADQMKYVVSKWFPQFPYQYEFDDKIIRLLLDVQIEAGLGMVSIPHGPRDERRLLDHFIRWAKYVEEYSQRLGRKVVAIPYVSMRVTGDRFRSAISGLWDARSMFPVVGLVYAPISRYKINYDFFRDHREEDTWLHMSSVPRATWRGRWGELANMHLPQIYGIDTVATSIPWGGGGEPLEDYSGLRYFDTPILSLPRIRTWVERHGSQQTDCPCPICRQRSFPEITDEFIIRRGRQRDLSPLFGVFRLHELFRSSVAFEEGRQFISENDFGRYLEERIGRAVDEHRSSQIQVLNDFT
ncbi:MAG: hypothetical protein KAW09_09380, partial [Thermoplasmata archaeon]|nr:hypothetical protein [Thermoplasmata archaeon]